MIGQNQICLNREAVMEALQDYVTKHFGDKQIVRGYCDWTPPQPYPMPPNIVVQQPVPGLMIFMEHARSFVTGTP